LQIYITKYFVLQSILPVKPLSRGKMRKRVLYNELPDEGGYSGGGAKRRVLKVKETRKTEAQREENTIKQVIVCPL
jgi:hypothetical protein